MASGTRTTDSFAEGLRKLLGSITDLKMADDANMPFTINLETMVLQQLKQGASAAVNGGQPTPDQGMGGPGGPGGPPMAGPGGMPMAGPAGPPGLQPAPVPGLMAGPAMPNPDELRRMLSQGNTALRLNNVAGKLAGLA